MTASADGEEGSATVWVAVFAALLCGGFVVVLTFAAAVSARHRAGAAADLAALAAADRSIHGQDAACAAAQAIAAAQHTRLMSCQLRGDVVDVVAEASLSPLGLGLPPARVRARAGPADISPVFVSAGRTVAAADT